MEKPAHGLIGLMPAPDDSETKDAQNLADALKRRREEMLIENAKKIAAFKNRNQKVGDN